mmetsp:Transcript_45390/g.55085  ORF Transcript_45390/g.55085 Transcript_45390/m.55085 type:complete len:89 (-) Transcript_45390:17-283(-)
MGARHTFLDVVGREEIGVVASNSDGEGAFNVVNLLPGLEVLYGLSKIDEETAYCNKLGDNMRGSYQNMVNGLGLRHYSELWSAVIQKF